MKMAEFIDAFGGLGAFVTPSESQIHVFEKFVCYLYRDQHVTYVN